MLKVAPAPIARIVPKNLLISAMRTLDDKVVRDNDVRESNLRDLCTLITMSILYDTLETLGNESELYPSRKPHIAEEYATIFKITELHIVPGPRPEEFEAVLERAAPAAAMLPFRAGRTVDQKQVRSQLMGALRESTSDGPDYWSDFSEGERLLATRDGGNATNSERFVLRSFLYVGLAQLRARPLVPDAARSRGALTTTARTYGDLLQEVVNEKYAQRAPQVTGSPIPLPPFAETALARCGSKRTALPEVLRELRQQLKPVRLALAALEAESEFSNANGVSTFFGTLLAGSSAVERDERFHEALRSLREARFALPPGLCVVAPVFDVIKAAIEVLTTHIHNPMLSLFGLTVNARDLLTGGRELQKLPERSTFMEIHHQLGARWWQSPSSLRELFGDVKPDDA